MNRYRYYFVISVLWMVLACGCAKKNDSSADKQTDVSGKPEAVVAQQPEIPDVSGIVLPTIEYDKKSAARPSRLSLNALIGLDPEKLEQSVMKSFDNILPPDNDNVLKVRKAADLGNDEAREKIAMYYLSFPPTDSRYELGVGYLKKVEKYRSLESLLTRGMIEYGGIEANAPKARPFFEEAMKSDDESTMQWLLVHESIGLFDQAWEKLKTLYDTKAASNDAEALFRLAELYNVYPARRDLEKFESYISRASELEYGPACYLYALFLLNRNQAENGLKWLKKAADLKVDEANAMLSFLYLVVVLKDTSESASEYAGSTITPELFGLLRADVISDKEKNEATVGDFFRIADYASKSNGNEQGCKVLFGMAGSGDWAVKIKDEAISCLEKFAAKSENRTMCDSIDGMFPFDSDELYIKVFSAEQRRKITSLTLSCYENVLAAGLDYSQPEDKVLSASTKLGMLYSGEVDDSVARDDLLSNQYLIYGAVKNDDMVAQMSIANSYLSGQLFGNQSIKRACYWADRVVKHEVCSTKCTGDHMVVDSDMDIDAIQAAMMVCMVCDAASQMLTGNCK